MPLQTLSVFIANAGVIACAERHSKDGFELQMGTKHLTYFMVFNLL
jgi:hypothetical protein